MEKITEVITFIKEHKKQVEIGTFAVLILILGVIFYSYSINLTWDSTEYIGLADYIGTDKMQTDWIGHRGIGFPLLIKISQIFGKNPTSMTTLMFIFYVGMLATIFVIYKKLNKLGILKNPILIFCFLGYILITIALNPILFGYYHTILTEFVALTFTILMCFICWCWKDYTWKENRVAIFSSAIVMAIIVVITYHVKQSLIVFVLIPIVISTILSIFDNFNYSNVVSKISTMLFIGITLLFSIQAWGNYMTFTKFDWGQILKYVLIFAVAVAIFVFVSIKLRIIVKKHNANEKVSKILKFGSIALVFIVLIGGYSYYRFYNPPIYPYELSKEEREEYDKIYSEKLQECIDAAKLEETIDDIEEENIIEENKGLDVLAISNSTMVNGKIILAVLPNFITNSDYFYYMIDQKSINRDYISYEDNLKIDKYYNGLLKNVKWFWVYRDNKQEEYYIYFFEKEDKFTKQLDYYLRILFNDPEQVYSSYKAAYWKSIYVREGEFSPFDRENYNIPSKIYLTGFRNVVDSNPDYEEKAWPYIHDMEKNLVNSILNWYMNKAIFVLLYKNETALWYLPVVLLVTIIVYLILKLFFRTKIDKEKMNVLQFVIILFSTSFFGIMSYVIFDAPNERYTIPGVIPSFLGYFLIGLLLLEFVVKIVKKIILNIKSKSGDKKTTKSKA